jgi:hypothetical protein
VYTGSIPVVASRLASRSLDEGQGIARRNSRATQSAGPLMPGLLPERSLVGGTIVDRLPVGDEHALEGQIQ